jgi:FkbM family methyltransferase
MKVEKLIANNQPADWFEQVTRECQAYPIDSVDIQKDELVLDIGANVGGFWNAWKWRFDNWHLVEPSVYNCEQIRANGYEGSYSRNAVGKSSGEVVKLQKYWGDGDNDTLSGNFGTIGFVNEGNGHGWQGEWEECVTLCFEDLIRDREVGLLKIDCEGAEYDFLMGKDLSKIKYIVMELHNFLGGVKQKQLMTHIENTHTEIHSEGDGRDSHFVKLWKIK